MSGGCFTICSLGGIGGRYFTPIINAPEVAILGVCRAATEPVWDGKQFPPRLMLPLSLSWDHRVIDGAAAARFNAYLGRSWRTSAGCCCEPSASTMTTVVVVRKAGQVAIAADAGDLRRHAPGRTATKPTTRCSTRRRLVASAWPARWRTSRCCARPCGAMPREELKLDSRDEVFDTFPKLHPKLKEQLLPAAPRRKTATPTRAASSPW